MSNIPEPIVNDIINAYQNGESRAKIAERLGVHKNTIGNLLKAQGVQLRPKNGQPGAAAGDTVAADLREKIAASYQTGATYEALAKEHRLTVDLVRSVVKAAGVTPRSRGFSIQASAWLDMLANRPEELAGLYRDGVTMEALAARYGVAPATVHKQLHRDEVSARPRGPARERREDGTLHCRKCDAFKPLNDFGNDARGYLGKFSVCKDCERAKYRIRMYDVAPDQFAKMMDDQDGACAICGAAPESERNGRNKFLCVDHCHTTTAVRGLLCHECNKALGHMTDSPTLLRAAADYLEKAKARETASPSAPLE